MANRRKLVVIAAAIAGLAASVTGSALAAQTPLITLPTPDWVDKGNDVYVCQSPRCGKGSVLSDNDVAAVPFLDNMVNGPNFSGKAIVNLISRSFEKRTGYGPIAISSSATRRVKDYTEVLASGTAVVHGKTAGFATAYMIGPGDDVFIDTLGANVMTATHNLAVALHSAGY